MANNKLTSPIAAVYPGESLTFVRQQLQTLVDQHPNTVEVADLQTLTTNDRLLCRYMRRKRGCVEQSIPFIFEALQWRKRQQVLGMKEQDFPKEFFEIGGLYIYRHDRHGNIILHIRTRLYQKVNLISELLKRFTIFMMYRADRMAEQANVGWILLFDCSEAGLINADLEMANFVVSTLRGYFPYGQKYVLVHNCPWFLSALRNVIFAMLPAHVRRSIKFCSDRNIDEFVERHNLPDYMGGGEQNSKYRWLPGQLKSTVEILKANDEEYKKVKKYYDKIRTIVQTPVTDLIETQF